MSIKTFHFGSQSVGLVHFSDFHGIFSESHRPFVVNFELLSY